MKSNTVTCTVDKPKKEVFAFLSKVENLTKWAPEFVDEVNLVDGKYIAKNPNGQVFFRFDIDEKTGVIDMYSGATEQEMTLAPMRVIELSENTTAIIFTIFRHPGVDSHSWHLFCDYTEKEIENIERIFS